MFALVLAALCISSAHGQVDETTLPRLMRERGFAPPEGFKALVLRIDRHRGAAPTTTAFDWEGTSDDRDDWWPASTVKIFAAVAALERLHALGYPIQSWLTYHYADEDVTMRMSDIVRQAIQQSSNPAFDLLFSLVGYEEIHRDFLGPNRLSNTVLMRAYGPRFRDPETERASSRYSPRISIRNGQRTSEIAERTGTTAFECADEGNCTTLRELADVMRRIMLHEELDPSERFRLERADLVVLRQALDVARNYSIAETFEQSCDGLEAWHKPGFALHWVSDVLFIRHRATRRRWVVAMAAQPDRQALDSAAQTLGSLLCTGF